MSAVPLRRFFLPSAHIPIPPPFPRFAFTGATAGENGAQPVLMERACPRAKGGAPAVLSGGPPCHRQGPSGIAGPVFFSLLSFRRCFRFFSRPLRPVSVSLFYCALRSLLSGAPAAPLRCVVLRPARCLPRHFSLSSVRSIFPAPLSSSPPPCFAPCPPRRCFRPVLGACSAFLLFPVRRFSRRPRGLTG